MTKAPVLPGLFDVTTVPIEAPPCRFCGSREPHDVSTCDGRQGALEHVPPFDPLLIAGVSPETWRTSEAAALSVEAVKDSQRHAVELAIDSGERRGRTDDEVQVILNLDGSSERPRRWELWKLGRIVVLRDAEGNAVRRLTRTNRRAVVWVTLRWS